MQRITVGTGPLTENDVVAIARGGAGVTLAADALEAIAHSRGIVESLADDVEPHYGISTGFGALATKHIPLDQRALLAALADPLARRRQRCLVETEVVRAMMALRLSTLATGHTGVRPQTAQALAALLDTGLTPLVHEYGSLGCSGDLAPLAHVALALLGEGNVRDASGAVLPTAEALAAHGLAPIELAEKEGLALINGTDGMLGQLLLACTDLDLLLRTADLTAAMSVEAMLGTDRVFAADLQALRPHPGLAVAAANMAAVLSESPIVASHAGPDCVYVQDAYSMRCAPQVTGAARDTLAHARSVAAYELASAVDNPVVLFSTDDLDARVQSNGNFHGAPVAYVLDFLAIPAADVASISERRTDRMLDVARSRGLPPFLADDPGVDSGHMIAQYTQAALVSELKRLAVPASVDSIPSSAMQEDHVSMGWSAARKLRRAVDALTRVVAIELLTAARALDLRAPLRPGPAERRGGGRATRRGRARSGPRPVPRAGDRDRASASSCPGAPSPPPTRCSPSRCADARRTCHHSARSGKHTAQELRLFGHRLLEDLADVDVEVPARERQHLGPVAQLLDDRVHRGHRGDVVLLGHHDERRAGDTLGGQHRPVRGDAQDAPCTHLVAERRAHDRLVADARPGRGDDGVRVRFTDDRHQHRWPAPGRGGNVACSAAAVIAAVLPVPPARCTPNSAASPSIAAPWLIDGADSLVLRGDDDDVAARVRAAPQRDACRVDARTGSCGSDGGVVVLPVLAVVDVLARACRPRCRSRGSRTRARRCRARRTARRTAAARRRGWRRSREP